MEKIDLIWLNVCDEMGRIDSNLVCLMGNLHEFWERTKNPEQKALAVDALNKLTGQIIPELNTFLNALEDSRTK